MKKIIFCIGIGANQLLPDFIEILPTKDLLKIELSIRLN